MTLSEGVWSPSLRPHPLTFLTMVGNIWNNSSLPYLREYSF